ncbi:3-ketoacyl-CoA synthase 17 [Amborella trichopoda]|uniref:3-ketoacyl-CoA synthase 17 n=1 Tax=Amborella trichopoda TaxID=13333 RepID=UPI0005D342BA|nr:3-ketoacyl-CoA synthase 17 [Amborella trichopoda]|eukprot:XP_011622528.1 3-ketoacyl-CoA synthase 17 [Amborella trichopoda]
MWSTFTALLALVLSQKTLSHVFSLLHISLPQALTLLFFLSLSLLLIIRNRNHTRIYLLDYTCYKPPSTQKCPLENVEFLVRRSRVFSPESVSFMRSIVLKSGIGSESYGAPFLFAENPTPNFNLALAESLDSVLTTTLQLLSKTRTQPSSLGSIVVSCGMFAPTPSLASFLVSKLGLTESIKTYNLSGMGCSSGAIALDLGSSLVRTHRSPVLVVVTENVSHNWYVGSDRSMLVTNCIFRVGCSAALLTSQKAGAKFELVRTMRTHHGSDDSAYKAAFQREDEKGLVGVSLTKDLVRVAGLALRDHIRALAPHVLPISQMVLYVCRTIHARVRREAKVLVPDFMHAFEHVCIHTGGKAVIDQVGKVLCLDPHVLEPAHAVLHRFGNTSGSLVFYEMAYLEAKGRIKKGDRVWVLAFGTGFKVCSHVWKALLDTCGEPDNPWMDCIHRYPVN